MSEYMILDWFWNDVDKLWLILLSLILTVIFDCIVKYHFGEGSEEFTLSIILSCIGLIPAIFVMCLIAPVVIVGFISVLAFMVTLKFITGLVPKKNNPS